MSGPLRYCGRADCRLCHPQPVEPEREHHELAEMLVGAAAVVLLCLFAFVLVPVWLG